MGGDPSKSALATASLQRLIYRSTASETVDLKALTQILQVSRRNNRKRGITGLLLACNNGFLQVLEGSSEAVNASFQRLSRDPRHRDVTLIEYGRILTRSFAHWNMRGVGLFTFQEPARSLLLRRYGLVQGGPPFCLSAQDALALLREVGTTIAEEERADRRTASIASQAEATTAETE